MRSRRVYLRRFTRANGICYRAALFAAGICISMADVGRGGV